MDSIEHYKKRVYYAQNREDLILRAFFPDLIKGNYVDIGAYDPDFESVTKYFYQQGWTGINVEPQIENYQRFVKKRPNDINVHAGIAAQKGTMLLRSYANHGLSTFSETMKRQYEVQHEPVTETYKDVSVDVITLKELLGDSKLNSIQFMKVDVEGLEFDVLKGNNWEMYRPEVLCVESNHINQDWQKLIVSKGYELVFVDGLNDYYCDRRTDRRMQFDYVRSVVLEKGGGIRVDDFEVILSLKKERDVLARYSDHLLNEIGTRDAQIKALQAKIDEQSRVLGSLKASSRHAVALIAKRIHRGSHE